MAEHNEIGKLGENIATNYLKDNGYIIIDRNFHVKGGEIDIICKENKDNKLHMKQNNICFVEVKTKKVNNFDQIYKNQEFSPENNLSKKKKTRINKAIKFYLAFNKIKEYNTDIKVFAIIVYINPQLKQAKIKFYKDFIL